MADQLGEAVLEVTANVGGAKTALTDLRTALTGIDTLAKNQSSSISAIGRAIEAANRSAIAGINGLADAYKRVQTQQEAVKRNAGSISQTATQSFLSRGVTPGTTSAFEQQRLASLERRADVRRLQTAGGGGGGVGSFLRDLRLREEGEKKVAATRDAGYKKAAASEKTLLALTDQRVKKEAGAQRQARGGGGIGGQLSNIATSSIIGGAFPLLFGQGAGASIGGFTGGLLGSALGPGGGFAGSLFGTIVGQTADTFNQLAEAIQKPLEALPQLIEGANLSGPGVELLAETLVGLGRTAEAEALILSDISSSLRPETALTAAAAQDEYQRSIAELQTRIGAFLSGPALQFSDWLAGLAERVAGIPEAGAAPSSQRALALRGQGVATGIGGLGLLGLAPLAGFALGGPLGAGVGFGLAAGGAGLATLGGIQIGAAGAEEEQVANAKAIEASFGRINELQSSRIALQNQIISLQQNEESNALAIAAATRDTALAQIEIQREQAKARYQALPGTPSAAAYESLKLELAALSLQAQAVNRTFEQTKTKVESAFVVPGSISDLRNQAAQIKTTLDNTAPNTAAFQALAGELTSIEKQIDEITGKIKNLGSGPDFNFLLNDPYAASIYGGMTGRSDTEVRQVIKDLAREAGVNVSDYRRPAATLNESGGSVYDTYSPNNDQAIKSLDSSISGLTNKNWTVNVAVDASTGRSEVQLG